MDREQILAEMRRTAAENAGVPLGKGRFAQETGIEEYDWLRYWSRFGDLQRDAGLERNQLKGAYDDDYLLKKLVELTRALQSFPTSREIKTKSRNDPNFPSLPAFERLGSKSQRIAKLATYCTDRPEYADIAQLLEPMVIASAAGTEQSTGSDGDTRYGFVYLVKGHPGEYKIGRTTLVDRRLSELGATASIEQELIHEIKTDDPVGVERYWHERFRDKRMRGEWFRLNFQDVKAFKRWRRIS